MAAATAGTTLLVAGAAVAAVNYWPGTAHSAEGLADAVRAGQSGITASARPAGGQMDGQWLKDIFAESAVAARDSSHRPQDPAAKPSASPRAQPPAPPPPAPPVYANPLRSIADLVPERIDMGADFGGSGPVYALGNAVITNATGDSAGWPGGGWITYRLTDGPAAGLSVYVAEDVTPAVQVGQEVSSSTVIANMFNGGAGIETGWAQPDGASAESQLPAAGAISGAGPFPTKVGLNFGQLLQAVGAPPGFGSTEAGSGILPPNYPTAWTAAMLRP